VVLLALGRDHQLESRTSGAASATRPPTPARNSFLLSLLTFGEGWHNNHHFYQASVRQGHHWWQIDCSWYILVVMSWFGLVWDLKPVPEHVLRTPRPRS